MLTVKAIKEIKNNGSTVGYTLQDVDTKKEMNVPIDSIKHVMGLHTTTFLNLYIDDTGAIKLGMSQEEFENKKNKAMETNSTIVEKEAQQKDKASNQSNMERLQYLVKTLLEASKVYYSGTDEIMTNFEYDQLYDELVALEIKTGIVLPNSPTINVGYEVVGELPKEKHDEPMLSLEKTKEISDLESFLGTRDGLLSWKLDGLTVVLHYNNGELMKAVTRGNGEIGEIVTPNTKQFKNVPKKISYNKELVLRGEAVIRYSTFNKINESLGAGAEQYKNPRNLCSGSVRQLDSKITATRNVEWYCFDIVKCSDTLSKNMDERFKFINDLGFQSVDYVLVNSSNIHQEISKFSETIASGSMDIPSDGLVLTFRDREYGNSLGRTAKSPRHSKAFKWEDETAETQLANIEWQVGRTGIITPVAIFQPVSIEGSTISRATLHNLSVMYDVLGQPYTGQKIRAYKANMIIPNVSWGDKVDDNDDSVDKLYIPSYCPCCGEETEIREDVNSGVLTLWCNNAECEAKGNRRLEHFVSRDAMNIDGISGATISTLSSYGLLTDFVSFYHLKEHKSEIVGIEGFGEISFNNMVQSIENSRTVKLANLIYALGIPGVGLSTAKLICKHFENDMTKTVCASYIELVNINGIGDVTAESFIEYFNDKDRATEFVNLTKELNIVKEEISTATDMAGVTLCVTGSVERFSSRRVIKDVVEMLGGSLTGSVSRSTDYLVTNDTTSGSNKNVKAQEYGIPILTEDEFISKFNLEKYVR